MKCPHCGGYYCVNETDCMMRDAQFKDGSGYKTLCVKCKKPLVVYAEVRVDLSVTKGTHKREDCDWPQYAGEKEDTQ